MEFITIHQPRGLIPLDVAMASLQLAKKLNEKPEELVPGGKLIAAYAARCKELVVCIWDVPNTESVVSPFEQLTNLGWDTEVIPAEKMTEAVPKYQKALEEAMKK